MNEELLKYFKGDSLAASVWESKYAYEGEKTPDDMHKRLASAFAQKASEGFIVEVSKEQIDTLSLAGKEFIAKLKKEGEQGLYQRYLHLFSNFKYIVPQGSVMTVVGTPTIASASNCWVVESPYDSYAGILHTDASLVAYYKRRGGAGTDLSNIRPVGTPTRNTAKTSTGVVSFMPRYSNTTREVAQAGRRK